jgi:hypothetical protein
MPLSILENFKSDILENSFFIIERYIGIFFVINLINKNTVLWIVILILVLLPNLECFPVIM